MKLVMNIFLHNLYISYPKNFYMKRACITSNNSIRLLRKVFYNDTQKNISMKKNWWWRHHLPVPPPLLSPLVTDLSDPPPPGDVIFERLPKDWSLLVRFKSGMVGHVVGHVWEQLIVGHGRARPGVHVGVAFRAT